MTWVGTAIVGSSLVNAYSSDKASRTQSEAAERAAETQAAAARYAANLQQQQYRENVERQQPFYDAGRTALNQLIPLATDYKDFGMEQFQADPGYGFRLSEGTKALERSAAARGGLISGGALKAATRFGQDMASNEYTNAFNRYQQERAARLGPLQSLAGVGQTTAAGLGSAGQTMASNVGNYGIAGANATAEGYLGSANARASGYIGTGNAFTSGLGTYLNYSNQQNLLAALKGNTGVNPYQPQKGFDASSVTV
jgi:hypothetical protein